MIKQILQTLEQVPLMSQNGAELLSIMNDFKADSSKLIGIVQKDPVLTMQVIHLCNSAYYSLPIQIVSVAHATKLLGNDTVAGLAMAEYFKSLLNCSEESSDNLWLNGMTKHTLAVAKLSNLMAKEAGSEASGAFTCGLLHDIGKFVLSKLQGDYAEKIQDIMNQNDISLFEAEREILGTDHAEIGLHLANRWNMPEVIKDAIHYHHNPLSCEYEQTLYVYLADMIEPIVEKEEDISKIFDSETVIEVIGDIGLNKERIIQLVE